MVKVALIGAGKMGISHLAILGAHKNAEIVGVADTSGIVTDVLGKYTEFPCYSDYLQMLDTAKPEAVFVAVPTKHHAQLVRELLNRNIHVFVEKPFCLDAAEGLPLVALAKEKKLVNQVGYHNKFIGTFNELKHLIEAGALGEIQHFSADMNGPVVIKSKQGTWRSKPDEGGGCLLDYAAHMIDLIHYLVAPITAVKGVLLKSFYSSSVEDGVFALLETGKKISGVLQVNWSDETFRKMSTQLTVFGTKGKVIADTTEIKVYLKEDKRINGYTRGWNIRHINEFAEKVDFYLRGEEYSAQVDHFIQSVYSAQA